MRARPCAAAHPAQRQCWHTIHFAEKDGPLMWRDKHESDTAPSFRIEPKELQDRKTHGSLIPSLLWLFGNVVVRMCGWQDWVPVSLGDCIQVKWNCHPPSKQDVYDQCKKIISSSFTCLLDTDKQLSAHCKFNPTVSRVGTYSAAYFGIVCSECIYSLHIV